MNFLGKYYRRVGKKLGKNLTKTQKQWLWFVVLWLFGFLSVVLMSLLIRIAF